MKLTTYKNLYLNAITLETTKGNEVTMQYHKGTKLWYVTKMVNWVVIEESQASSTYIAKNTFREFLK